MKISNILDKIDEFQLFVPAFQREYVWKRDDAKQLIDSLIKEYPTGTMLTWETSNPPELKGPHKYKSDQGAVKLLLDGQQRITTLYMLIRGEIPPYYTLEEITNSVTGLHVHLKTLELSYYMKTRMEGNPLWRDITDIFQRKVRLRHVIRAIEQNGEEVSQELEDLIDDNIGAIERIVDREFPEQIIPPKASIKESIDIFYKVNASGVALTDAELALAQISGYWPEARDTFKSKLKQLDEQGFSFKLDFIIYALLACMYGVGSDMRKLHGEENLSPELNDEGAVVRAGIKDVWSKLETSVLDYVVNLLRSKGFVDHTQEINSVYALIPIIYFCYLKVDSNIPELQLQRIIKWFYYSQFRQRYVSQLPQKLDFDLRIIKEGKAPFEELIGVIGEERRLELSPEDFIGRSVSHPLFAMLKWYIKSQGATCFSTGLGLHKNMGSKYQLENDHIFPSAILKKHGYSRDNRVLYQYAQELTNRAILTQVANRKKSDSSAEDYLKSIYDTSPNALKKQCIPENQELWKIENYELFLEARRSLLAEKINAYLDSLSVELDEDFGEATLEEMISEGESSDLEFKQSLRWGSTDPEQFRKGQGIIMKTIAGFTNSYEGGTLLMGVADDCSLVGLEKDYASLKGDKDEFELHLGQLIDNEFGKAFRAKYLKISFPVVNGVEICRVDVKPGNSPHFTLVKDKNGQKGEKFYVRSGNSTQELSPSEAGEFIRGRFD